MDRTTSDRCRAQLHCPVYANFSLLIALQPENRVFEIKRVQ